MKPNSQSETKGERYTETRNERKTEDRKKNNVRRDNVLNLFVNIVLLLFTHIRASVDIHWNRIILVFGRPFARSQPHNRHIEIRTRQVIPGRQCEHMTPSTSSSTSSFTYFFIYTCNFQCVRYVECASLFLLFFSLSSFYCRSFIRSFIHIEFSVLPSVGQTLHTISFL